MDRRKFFVEDSKIRLDKFLVKKLLDKSRSQIQRDIEAGKVLVNGKIIKESKFVVRQKDEIESEVIKSRKQAKEIKPTYIPLSILYNNHGLLIIDKPAGMVVHPGAGFKGETLASALLYEFKNIKLVGEEGRSGIVHRLDKDTSGVILVAKTQSMYEHLKNAFLEGKIKKEYIALVQGKLEKLHGFIDTAIGKSKLDFRKYDVKNIIEPKESLTEYRVLEYLERVDPVRSRFAKGTASAAMGRLASNGVDQYTLILVKLHTGRTHQIRVHFKSIGHPLVGDSLYGGKTSNFYGLNHGLNRQFLHAKKIEVRLPDGTWIEAESELAEDLKKILVSLGSKVVKQL